MKESRVFNAMYMMLTTNLALRITILFVSLFVFKILNSSRKGILMRTHTQRER
jgi:hypothetical protein